VTSLGPPSTAELQALLAELVDEPLSYGDLAGCDEDRYSCALAGDFADARQALRDWRPFHQPWLRLEVSGPPEPGRLVAVSANAYGFWWTNVCRVTEVIDESDHFSFTYGTLAHHVESGRETFRVCRSAESAQTRFEIEATSRPRHPLVRLAYPLARHTQRRFARGAMAAMGEVSA
jgi:uncharacterized protein (UPF0548 family)